MVLEVLLLPPELQGGVLRSAVEAPSSPFPRTPPPPRARSGQVMSNGKRVGAASTSCAEKKEAQEPEPSLFWLVSHLGRDPCVPATSFQNPSARTCHLTTEGVAREPVAREYLFPGTCHPWAKAVAVSQQKGRGGHQAGSQQGATFGTMTTSGKPDPFLRQHAHSYHGDSGRPRSPFLFLSLSSSFPFHFIFILNVYLFERDKARVEKGQREGDTEPEAGSGL